MHIKRPSHLQIPRMVFTPLLMRRIRRPLDLLMARHTLPAKRIPTLRASDVIAPGRFLDPPPAALPGANLGRVVQSRLGQSLVLLSLLVARSVLLARLARVPGAEVEEALLVATGVALHVIAVVDVELAVTAARSQAPREFGETCQCRASCEGVVLGERFW